LKVFDSLSLPATDGSKPTSKQKIVKTVSYFGHLFVEFGLDYLTRRTGHDSGTAYSPSAFSVFAAHKVTSASPFAFDLAACSNFDPFTQTLMGFLFRHLANSFKIIHLKQPENVKPVFYAM